MLFRSRIHGTAESLDDLIEVCHLTEPDCQRKAEGSKSESTRGPLFGYLQNYVLEDCRFFSDNNGDCIFAFGEIHIVSKVRLGFSVL